MNKNEFGFPLPEKMVTKSTEKGVIKQKTVGEVKQKVWTEEDRDKAEEAAKKLFSEKGRKRAEARKAEIEKILAKNSKE